MASQVAEELITVMTIDDTQFQTGGRRVIAMCQQMTNAVNQLRQAMGAIGGAMGNINFGGGNIFNFNGGGSGGSGGSGGGMAMFGGFYFGLRIIREVEGAIVNLGHRFVEFSKNALDEYASFDTLRLSFEGIYGSAAKAQQMMSYLRDTAMTSAFHFKDLADAARGLAVSGLDVNRFLPIVQGFSLAMGKISGEGLQDFIGILRRIEGGNTGFALGPRGIGRYGVSREEMERYGAQFDGPNRSHFTGTTEQALNIIEDVFNARFKAIASKVSASSEVVLSNWSDMIQQATIDAGAGIAQNLIEPIKRLTSAGNELRQAGIFKDLFDTLFQIIGIEDLMGNNKPVQFDFSKNDDGTPRTKAEEKAARAAYERKRFGEGSQDDDFYRTPDSNPNGARWATTTGDPVKDLLIKIGGTLVSIMEFSKLSFLELSDLVMNLTHGKTDINPESLVGDALRSGRRWANEAYDDAARDWRERSTHPDRYKAPAAPDGNGLGLDDDEANEHLKKIEHHTRSLAESMRAGAFGGGDVGRLGVSPVELSQMVKGSGVTGRKFANIFNMDALAEAIDYMVGEQVAHLARNGAFG